MSKFERINSNRFGMSQFRTVKQLVEYQKQETEREKIPKEQPLCCEQYINPFIQCNHHHHNEHVAVTLQPTEPSEHNDNSEIQSIARIQSDDSLTLLEPKVEHPEIYHDKDIELKPDASACHLGAGDASACHLGAGDASATANALLLSGDIENIRTEFVQKQSLKDVVKLSYRTFLKKEPSFI